MRSGNLTVVAGTGTAGSLDGPSMSATFNGALGLTGTADGTRVWLVCYTSNTLRRLTLACAPPATSSVTPSPSRSPSPSVSRSPASASPAPVGTIWRVAGAYGVNSNAGDGGPALAATISVGLTVPAQLAFDAATGRLFIATGGAVRNVSMRAPVPLISRYAGSPSSYTTSGYGGDGLPATAVGVLLRSAGSVLWEGCSRRLFIADGYNNAIRVVDDVSGIISAFAAVPATCTTNALSGLAWHNATSTLYVACSSATAGVFSINAFGTIATYVFDVPAAQQACGLAIVNDALYICWRSSALVRGYKLLPSLNTTSFLSASSGTTLVCAGMAADPISGNVYISNTNGNIQRISPPSGALTVVAGPAGGGTGSVGDFGAATSASLNYPEAVAFDVATGTLHILDWVNRVIRAVRVEARSGVPSASCPPTPSLSPSRTPSASVSASISSSVSTSTTLTRTDTSTATATASVTLGASSSITAAATVSASFSPTAPQTVSSSAAPTATSSQTASDTVAPSAASTPAASITPLSSNSAAETATLSTGASASTSSSGTFGATPSSSSSVAAPSLDAATSPSSSAGAAAASVAGGSIAATSSSSASFSPGASGGGSGAVVAAAADATSSVPAIAGAAGAIVVLLAGAAAGVLMLRRRQRKRAVVARDGSSAAAASAAVPAAAAAASDGGHSGKPGSTNPLHASSGRRVGGEPLAASRPAAAAAASRAASFRVPATVDHHGGEWEECFSKSRQLPYWRHRISGETTWDNPTAAATARAAGDSAGAWEECFSNSRKAPYWRHRQSGETTWDNPITATARVVSNRPPNGSREAYGPVISRLHASSEARPAHLTADTTT